MTDLWDDVANGGDKAIVLNVVGGCKSGDAGEEQVHTGTHLVTAGSWPLLALLMIKITGFRTHYESENSDTHR
jgi:hypothetical protein